MDTLYVTVVRDTVGSTQDVAADAFVLGEAPVLVVSARQTGGRGRLGRSWWEGDRSLYTSLAFSPPWAPTAWGTIPLVAGLAARTAFREICGVDIDLHWPNDLYLGADKVGGILSEAADERVVVGCGANLWWAEPPAGAGSILGADPGSEIVARLAATWADDLLDRLDRGPQHWGRDEYRRACMTLDRDVTREGAAGRAIDVAHDGALVVSTSTGPVHLHAGEVTPVTATLPAIDPKGAESP